MAERRMIGDTPKEMTEEQFAFDTLQSYIQGMTEGLRIGALGLLQMLRHNPEFHVDVSQMEMLYNKIRDMKPLEFKQFLGPFESSEAYGDGTIDDS